ncbi:MAG TPA: CDP-glycerol glycerophosphotransferase family protein [Vicinamibacteria bacterium]
MKTLLVWGGGSAEQAHARAGRGATLVARDPAAAETLRQAGFACRAVGDTLGVDEQDRIDEAAIAWTKSFGGRPLLDGRRLGDLLQWKGVSLWWFAELYLHHSTSAPRHVRWIETCERLLAVERPDEVEAEGLDPVETLLLARTCTARGVLFPDAPRRMRSPGAGRVLLQARLNRAKARGAVLKSRLRGCADPTPARQRRVLFLSHAAFWRRRPGERELHEHYFDRLIPAVQAEPGLEAVVVAVGPPAAHRRRGVRDRLRDWLDLRGTGAPYLHVNRYTDQRVLEAMREAERQAYAVWKTLRAIPATQEAFSHHGVAFADLCEADLAGTLLLQLPWAVRCWEEMANVLRAARPDLVCLYAESSGWGRAAVAACRAAGVPTLAIQHGILYPKYYSYRRGPEEGGGPLPDRTALFGESARRLLLELGRYPRESLVLTGSPKFDELVAAAAGRDRPALRRGLGVGEDERLVVVASRYRAIRDTHASIGPVLSSFVRAIESLPGVRCLVKPHPAEAPGDYRADLAGATRIRVLPAAADLVELLHAADLLVTVESLSAVEALVLARPVVVLNQPNHLRELVDRGVALGVAAGEDPKPALEAALFDAATRGRLEAARARYLDEVALGVDGRATERLLALIREQSGAARDVSPPAGVVVSSSQ